QKLRTLPNGNSVKVVAVTAFASPNDKHLFISQGFDEYLPKPIEDVALLSLVKSLVK
ncbi:MAG: response regulator, partial [Cytophagales bacterium]